MKNLVSRGLRTALAGVVALGLGASAAAAADLQKLRIASPAATVSAGFADWVIPEYLGYYAEEGLSVEVLPIGSNAAAVAALNSKRVEFYMVSPAFQLPLIVKGQDIGISIYETTYPFKYGLAVNPDSPIKSIKDLSGKNVGVSNLGTSDYPVGQTVVKLGGAENVNWLAVGEGAAGGHALQKGDVSGMFYYDTGFGTIEAAGIPLRYLDIPPSVPKIGAVLLTTSHDMLQNHRDWAVGVARAITKAHVFIRENPAAAAYIFAKMFPEATPKGKSMSEAIDAILIPLKKRMQLYYSYDPSITQDGFIKEADLQDELNFAGLGGQLPDMSAVYTNDLVKDINDFDVAKIKADADNFQIPAN